MQLILRRTVQETSLPRLFLEPRNEPVRIILPDPPRITINTLSECDACTLVCSHENCVCFRDLIEFANANENVAQEIALRYCNLCKFVQNSQDNLPSFSVHSAAGFRPCIRRVSSKTPLSSPGQSCSACSSSLLSSLIHFRRRLLSGFILFCEILQSPLYFLLIMTFAKGNKVFAK